MRIAKNTYHILNGQKDLNVANAIILAAKTGATTQELAISVVIPNQRLQTPYFTSLALLRGCLFLLFASLKFSHAQRGRVQIQDGIRLIVLYTEPKLTQCIY